MRSSSGALALLLLFFVPACNASPPASDDGGGVDANAIDSSVRNDAAARSCFVDEDCNDGFYCNGTEACVMGFCTRMALACDDGIPCTDDLCNENTHACVSRAPDADGDGYGDATCHDGSGVPLGNDCDDTDPTLYPGSAEICDAIDQDCDPTTLGGGDNDHDGATPTTCCNPQPDGLTLCGRDCDDTNPSISQLATEICDTIDNDCDGNVDESTLMMSYPDVDLDGYGDASATPDIVCVVPSSRANQGGDCDDAQISVHPLATERCNGIDDDCDGTTDEGAGASCTAVGSTMECISGECAITGCDPTHFDCNGVASDGCETALCASNANCGSCGGDNCGAGINVCNMGQCVLTADLIAHALGGVYDAVTGAPIAGATITTLDVCPTATATSAADGSYDVQVRDHARPRWVRIEAAGYPPHVQPVGVARLFPSSVVDAWRADPDAATTGGPTRAIVVVEGSPVFLELVHGTVGPGNSYSGSDLAPSVGGDGTVFMGANPGHLQLGGHTDLGGGCSSDCTPVFELWLEGGAVTHVVAGAFSCGGVC